MCGIVGVIGLDNPREYILNGLKTLDYRGYDSAGLAYLNKQEIIIHKDVGSVEHLMSITPKSIVTNLMIGHTRWATHGIPNKENTHPHISFHKTICLVHNGVIENYREIKEFLLEKGYVFYGQTDSEIVANLIDYHYQSSDILKAIQEVIKVLKGNYAITLFTYDDESSLYILKKGSPLVIGEGDNFNLVASDASPMIKFTNSFIELNDYEFGKISKDKVEIYNLEGNKVQKEEIHKDVESISHDLKGYPHYMLKEIEEIEQSVNNIINAYYKDDKFLFDPKLINALKESDHIMFIACGTSYHSSLVGGRYFEYVDKSTSKYIASEWAFHPTFPGNKPFIILISQSGETADLIHCLQIIKKHNLNSLVITNTGGSTLDRNCNYSLLLHAGIEVSVASTKAYVAQVTMLALLSCALKNDTKVVNDLRNAVKIFNVIKDNYKPKIIALADELKDKTNIFYLGRGFDYFLSLEASLKLKEVSYIHSEAVPGGELKHGPIALIEKDTPVIVFITDPETASGMRGNIEEVKARGAKVYVISINKLSKEEDTIVVPNYAYYLSSVAISAVAFYLAYYVSLAKGLNVDKPRNLAKSVTVE